MSQSKAPRHEASGEAGVHLSTIILDYEGGTYVRQVRAAGTAEAVRVWAADLSRGSVPELAAPVRDQLARGVAEDEPVALSGMRNAWCCTGLGSGGLGLVNVVRTAEE